MLGNKNFAVFCWWFGVVLIIVTLNSQSEGIDSHSLRYLIRPRASRWCTRSVIMQYNLEMAKLRWCSAAGKVTAGL